MSIDWVDPGSVVFDVFDIGGFDDLSEFLAFDGSSVLWPGALVVLFCRTNPPWCMDLTGPWAPLD